MNVYDRLAPYYRMLFEGKDEAIQAQDVQWLDELFLNRGIQTVLDCSCGDGFHAIPLAQMGYDICGADKSRGMIRRARQYSRKAGSNLNFVVLDFRKLDRRFPPASFQAVLALGHSLAHLFSEQDLLTALQQMRRTLCPLGWLVADLPELQPLKALPRLSEGYHDRVFGKELFLFSQREFHNDDVTLKLFFVESVSKRCRAKQWTLRFRCWSPSVLESVAQQAGLRLIESAVARGGKGRYYVFEKPAYDVR